MSVLYPAYFIGLSMFFYPFEMFLDFCMGHDPTKEKFHKGNFAPVKTELSYDAREIVSGKVPTDINGVFLRNGTNPMLLPKTGNQHWFDGDGMIHACEIKDG